MQASPKNSIFFRTRNTRVGHVLGYLSTMDIDVPLQECGYVGIIKNGNILLINLVDGQPEMVWRKKANSWSSEEFLGYQLISSYTLIEFHEKKELIKKAFQMQWQLVQKNSSNIHGDFTHFNILVEQDGEINFIDRKENQNSILFDFFYFYAYIRQCLARCSTLSKADEVQIVEELEEIIRSICVQKLAKTQSDILAIKIPEISGLIKARIPKLEKDFEAIFQD